MMEEGSRFQEIDYIVGLALEELCGSGLTPFRCSIVFPDPSPQEDGAKFFEFSKRAEDGPSRAGSKLSKMFC